MGRAAVFTAGAGAGVGAGAGAGLLGAGGALVVAGVAGSDFGEHAATSAMPAKGVISMKRRREVDRVMKISCGDPDNPA